MLAKQIITRIPVEEFEEFYTLAKNRCMSVAGLVRFLIIKELERVKSGGTNEKD